MSHDGVLKYLRANIFYYNSKQVGMKMKPIFEAMFKEHLVVKKVNKNNFSSRFRFGLGPEIDYADLPEYEKKRFLDEAIKWQRLKNSYIEDVFFENIVREDFPYYFRGRGNGVWNLDKYKNLRDFRKPDMEFETILNNSLENILKMYGESVTNSITIYTEIVLAYCGFKIGANGGNLVIAQIWEEAPDLLVFGTSANVNKDIEVIASDINDAFWSGNVYYSKIRPLNNQELMKIMLDEYGRMENSYKSMLEDARKNIGMLEFMVKKREETITGLKEDVDFAKDECDRLEEDLRKMKREINFLEQNSSPYMIETNSD